MNQKELTKTSFGLNSLYESTSALQGLLLHNFLSSTDLSAYLKLHRAYFEYSSFQEGIMM